MIKFACPGCSAVFSVGDEKAGKTGNCPKCSAKFLIPDAEPQAINAAPAAFAPPPAHTEDNTIEIKPCPGCMAKLTVETGDLGLDVECPYCKAVYKAERSDGKGSQSSLRDRPSRQSRDRDADDDPYDNDRPKRRSRRDDSDLDDDDRPKRRRRRTLSQDPSKTAGITSLILGIMALFPGCCCALIGFPLGVAAVISGIIGLKTAGRGMAIAGMILGIIAIVLTLVGFIFNIMGGMGNIGNGGNFGNFGGQNQNPVFGPRPAPGQQQPPFRFGR